MFEIKPVTTLFDQLIQAKIDSKTKPLGALGQLEPLASQLAKIQLSENSGDEQPDFQKPLAINSPSLLVFAGDHGVASEGVSIAPSEVTGQMVANFATGGAAINVFCRQFGWQLKVIDAGILHAPDASLSVVDQRLGATTEPLHKAPAMSKAQLELGFAKAKSLIAELNTQGSNLVAFGEMGIGNTTSASAIMAAIMSLPASETVGKGTGVTDDVVIKKQQVIEQAFALHADSISQVNNLSNSERALEILRCLGGFEIVQICASMLAAAEQGMTVVVDGFICTAAAMVALEINPELKSYLVFAHCSGEQGHQKMLAYLNVEPLLNLGLRLGEGTGGALALPLIQAAAAFYNDMASFAQADVTNVV